MSTATPFLGPIDLALFELQNARWQQLASDPGSPVEGQFWENVTTHELKWFNGTDVITVGSSDAAGTVTSVTVETANGFAGTVDDDTADAQVTIKTTVTGLLLGDGTTGEVSAATPGTDYLEPDGDGSGLSGLTQSQISGLAAALAALAPLASPTFTGTPLAPTATAGTNTTQIATTAFVAAVAALLAPLASPALTGNPTAPTQTAGNNSTRIATTAYTDGAVGTETSRAETAEALLAPKTSPALSGTPTAPTPGSSDNSTTIATTAFVQAVLSGLAQGIQFKPTATVAATAALPAGTYSNGASGVGATFTVTATGATTVDGHVLAANDLVLLTAQATAAQNGLYTVTTAGTTGVSTVLTRHADMDQAGEFPGAFIPVSSTGTSNGNSLWLANPSGAVTVGTTTIPLTQLNGATDLVAGAGISISGNTISATGPQKYTSGELGDGSATTLTVTHNLGNQYPDVAVWLLGGSNPVKADCRVESTGSNTLNLIFGAAPAADTIVCTVTG